MYIYEKFTDMDTYDYDSFYDTIQSQRATVIRNELEPIATRFSLDDFDNAADVPENCSVSIDGWQFDLFFNRINVEKLYVVLSGSRKADDPLPLFKRWSWNAAFDGSVLYISDPMFYKFEDCALGWYFGSEEFNIYTYIRKIIDILKKKYAFQHIIFYGSSGGGFAALQAAAYCEDSLAIAINPQIYINRYPYYARAFKRTTGIDLDLPDKYNRNKIDGLLKNSSSKFLIIQNASDKHGCTAHIFPLLQKYNIKPKYGLQKHDNIYLWIYDAIGGHDSQEDMHILQFILFIADAIIKKEFISDVESKFALALNEIWAKIYWLKYYTMTNSQK